MNNEELVQSIIDKLTKVTALPLVYFDLEDEKPSILSSKIGGAFYVPEELELPTAKDGSSLHLLAQINFGEIPSLEDFPKQGLLQIFICPDDLYGCDFDNMSSQENWRICYIENLPSADQIDESRIFNPTIGKDMYMPFDEGTEYKLNPVKTTQGISVFDYRFEDAILKYCAEIVPSDSPLSEIDDEVYDELYDKADMYACQLGGYPTFTQYDPRGYTNSENMPDVLLFQLDTVKDIMWGDSGVANFFITREDLRNKNFSNVWYNWDCC